MAKTKEKKSDRERNLLILVLVGILVLSAFLRLWKIGGIPPGLFGDEVDTGYQAYSILKTGRDYFGNHFPVHFQSLGDWRVPLYIYLDTVFVAILGLNELAVRLPSAILGILGVLLTFFLAKKITSDEKVSLLSALLLSISPWHTQVSRVGLEVIFLPVLFPLGLLLFWKGKEEKRTIWLVLSAFFLGFTPYAYSTPKLFLPLLILILLLFWGKELLKKKKSLIVFLVTLFVVLLPFGLDLAKGSAQARFLGISIFSNPEVPEKVRVARQNCSFQGLPARILHNKVTVWFDDFSKNYLSSISTDFLFGRGDPNPRHSIGERGELYLWELPFLLLGLTLAIFKAFQDKEKIYQFLITWLVLAPIPAALTSGGGTHALRLFLFLPWLQILTASGMVAFWGFLKSQKIKIVSLVVFALIIFVSFMLYFHQYFVHYPKIPGRWWNYGYRDVFNLIREKESSYQKIYITSSWEPSAVYSFFYSQISPLTVQKEISPSVRKIDKYHFYTPDLMKIKRGEIEPKTLYIINPAEAGSLELDIKNSKSIQFMGEIKSPDGQPVFIIFSSKD